MKLKGLILMLAISLSLFGFCACGDKNAAEGTTENSAENTTVAITYEQISQDEAKRIMDTEEGYVIIDARTEEEFREGHIEGAILIPEYEITDRAGKEIPEKEKLLEGMLWRNEKQNKSYAYLKEVPNSKKAILRYKLIARSENYHLLEVDLQTGRHHQIRCQLSKMG